ncbi:hypothetical protein KU616_24345, partial [Salmonella enterica subsp. enterica serovar Mbandaka]|nr:hypothetical protein [Salmonella enterica subsp. enterica serovar Mbandaka]
AGRHLDIFQHIRKSTTTFNDAFFQHHQALFQQNNIGGFTGDVVIGSDIEGLSDDALAALAARTTLFARLTPMHKERIVTLL